MDPLRKLYIDTCLIIGYYNANDPDNQHQRAINFFDRVKNMTNIKLYCSPFTITEFVQGYVGIHNQADEQAYKIANSLLLSNKINKKYPFDILRTKGIDENYEFEDFFIDIQTILLNTTPRPGIADSIHATIMKNNNINEIVTFNIRDFQNIDGITSLLPEDI